MDVCHLNPTTAKSAHPASSVSNAVKVEANLISESLLINSLSSVQLSFPPPQDFIPPTPAVSPMAGSRQKTIALFDQDLFISPPSPSDRKILMKNSTVNNSTEDENLKSIFSIDTNCILHINKKLKKEALQKRRNRMKTSETHSKIGRNKRRVSYLALTSAFRRAAIEKSRRASVPKDSLILAKDVCSLEISFNTSNKPELICED